MIAHDSACSDEVLDRYLSHRLSESEQANVEKHLDECDPCRARLEQMAASEEFWDAAGASLRAQEVSLREHGPDDDTLSDEAQTADSLRIFVDSYLTASDDPAALGRMAGYDVTGIVGHGSMGIVLKAFDKPLNRYVAVKVLSPTLSSHSSSRHRFSREARAAAAVVHPNVVAIHSISEWNGLPYLVMPYVGGESLQARLDRNGPLSVSEVLRVGCQIASGLAAAHAQGLIHRDIKPSNILLEQGVDRLLITDFGLAQAAGDASLTRSGVIAGTPQYMSPEQARGEAIDHRSDLFSLGSVLYALCTGHPPFRAETAYGVLRRISDETPRNIQESNPRIPAWLCRILSRLHARDPADRYESAEAVAQLFEQCLAHVQQPSLHPLPDAMIGGEARRNIHLLSHRGWVAIVSATVLVAATYFAARPERDHRMQPERPSSSGAFEQHEDLSDRLRYVFPRDEEVAFLITMTSQLPDMDTQLDGLAIVNAERIEGEQYRLRLSSDLQLSETANHETAAQDGLILTQSGNRWRNWNGRRAGVVVVSDTGLVISRHGMLDLPFDLGTLSELIVPPLPERRIADMTRTDGDQVLVTTSGATPERVSTDGLTTTLTSGGARIVFNVSAGVVDSVQVDRTLTIRSDNVERRIPTHIEVIRISEAERLAWENRRAESRNESGGRTGPLSPDEERRLLADLRDDRRVLFWLHNLNRRPAKSYSRDVVNAVTALIDHPSQTCRTMAQRLVDRIPDEQLNPFQELE